MTENKIKQKKEVLCYASALGNCSNVQTKEHYISRSFFTNNMLTVEGQNWLDGGTKTVSYKKLGLKILCKYHNELLSSVDSAGADVGRKIDELNDKVIRRGLLKRSAIWRKDIYYINGLAFEQWMIKAAVGGASENKTLRWHNGNSKALNPPIEILNAQFGLSILKYPMGLYQLVSVGETYENEQRAGIAHLHHFETKGYVGALINFRNIQFLIYLHDEPNLGIFESFRGTTFGAGHNEPMYHPQEMIFTTKGKISSVVRFDWNLQPIKLI